MRAWELLDEAIDLLCGATSGFIRGSQDDCEWENRQDALLSAYADAKLKTVCDAKLAAGECGSVVNRDDRSSKP